MMYVVEVERVWKRIRNILATMCQTKLWIDRNEAVYRAASIDICGSTNSYWWPNNCCDREERACTELLKCEPTGVQVFTGPSHGQPRITHRRSRHGLRYTRDLTHSYYHHGIDNLNHKKRATCRSGESTFYAKQPLNSSPGYSPYSYYDRKE